MGMRTLSAAIKAKPPLAPKPPAATACDPAVPDSKENMQPNVRQPQGSTGHVKSNQLLIREHQSQLQSGLSVSDQPPSGAPAANHVPATPARKQVLSWNTHPLPVHPRPSPAGYAADATKSTPLMAVQHGFQHPDQTSHQHTHPAGLAQTSLRARLALSDHAGPGLPRDESWETAAAAAALASRAMQDSGGLDSANAAARGAKSGAAASRSAWGPPATPSFVPSSHITGTVAADPPPHDSGLTLQIAQDGTVTPARVRPPISVVPGSRMSSYTTGIPPHDGEVRSGLPMSLPVASTPMAGRTHFAGIVPRLPLDGKKPRVLQSAGDGSANQQQAGVGSGSWSASLGDAAPASDGANEPASKTEKLGSSALRPNPDAKVPLLAFSITLISSLTVLMLIVVMRRDLCMQSENVQRDPEFDNIPDGLRCPPNSSKSFPLSERTQHLGLLMRPGQALIVVLLSCHGDLQPECPMSMMRIPLHQECILIASGTSGWRHTPFTRPSQSEHGSLNMLVPRYLQVFVHRTTPHASGCCAGKLPGKV